ncbi:hypothetical protein Taro_031015, partial [Colocasia esculenta]|nr:hypothetical protein [Colocasia esculenta]
GVIWVGRSPEGNAGAKIAGGRNWETVTQHLGHTLRLIKQKVEIIPMSTLDLYEKVIEACQEKDLMSSSEPVILSPILDVVCNGHYGGYERGCGLGWSRMSRWGDIANQASNDNIKQLTLELQNAKAEIETMHTREKEREEAMQAREREMQGRMERMEAMLTMHFSNSSIGRDTMKCPTTMLIEMEYVTALVIQTR